jgi:TolB protein
MKLLIVVSGMLLSTMLISSAQNPPIQGRLAVIGEDYNVRTMNAEGGDVHKLTEDGGLRRAYQWPTWSLDGQLAYFCCDLRVATSPRTQAFISSDGQRAGEEVFRGTAESIIYAAWSPGCGFRCRDLALLINNVLDGSLRVDLLRQGASDYQAKTLALGSPFYFSWRSDGSQLAFHRNNRLIDVFDVAQESYVPSLSVRSSGTFQALSWSPVDDRVLVGVAESNLTTLATLTREGRVPLVRDVRGFISFLWSPDGNFIAYRAIGDRMLGEVVVVDSRNGQEVGRTRLPGTVAFFWSPDSQKLALVLVGNVGAPSAGLGDDWIVQQSLQLSWVVYNLESGVSERLISFTPTYETQYVISYFDQFAPSHRLWSPDSRALVYGAEGDAGTEIYVLDVASRRATSVAKGRVAVWSFE